MRDFRDAKAMARTMRAALDAKGLKITNSESLELIAEAFGVADWNTLSAMIRKEPPGSASQPPTAEGVPVLRFSVEFATTMRRALAYANQRNDKYATCEHLCLALADDPDASGVMTACNADLVALKRMLADYIDDTLKFLVVDSGEDAKPTPAFQRVVQRAGLQAQGSSRPMVTGANALVAIFAESSSPAAVLLGVCGISREKAANLVARG